MAVLRIALLLRFHIVRGVRGHPIIIPCRLEWIVDKLLEFDV